MCLTVLPPVSPSLVTVCLCREMVGKQDPYCLAEFHDQRQRSNTVREGGTNPYFNEEELELCVFLSNQSCSLFLCFPSTSLLRRSPCHALAQSLHSFRLIPCFNLSASARVLTPCILVAVVICSWVDGENWQFPVRFSVYDEDVGRDDFIGGASFSVLPFLTTTKRQEVILTLQVHARVQLDCHLENALLCRFPGRKSHCGESSAGHPGNTLV